jgi:DNA polymerase I-like protein with 3'-5' exonuclease and polymerase domains
LLEGIGSSFNEAGEIEWDREKAKGLHLCPDGRSRASLIPFGTKTSRPTPPGRKFLFTNSHWMRLLMRPGPGRAIVYFDYTAQEVHIAAALSGDPGLAESCTYTDPHMQMAIRLGLAPPEATADSHRPIRKIGKTLDLAMLYGGTARMINALTRVGRGRARDFYLRLRASFPVYYRWSDRFAYRGLSAAPIWSPLGWRFWPRFWKHGEEPDRTCRNFPIQSAAADIARVILIRALEARLAIIAVIHDAFVFECSVANVEKVKEVVAKILTETAIDIIGKPIPFDCKVTCYPDRFHDKDGAEDFDKLMRMLEKVEEDQKVT